MENKTEVKINIDEGAVKMGELLENGKNLRKFVLEVIAIICMTILLLPISWAFAHWLLAK